MGPVPTIATNHVSKRYGSRLVLSDVNLQFHEGERVLVVGANGSGKTTLLRLLSTYAKPSTGTLTHHAPDDAQYRRTLGVAGHTPLVWDDLTVSENLHFAARAHDVNPDHVQTWIDNFGLDHRRRQRVRQLSRGYQQRVALARAFLTAQRVLLLDEPTTGLDEDARQQLRQNLGNLPPNVLAVIATHQPDDVRPIATRLLEINRAQVRDWGDQV